MIQYKVHVQINVYTNVPHTIHVLFVLSKISKDILRTCLRTFEADTPKIFKNVQASNEKFDVLIEKKSVLFNRVCAVADLPRLWRHRTTCGSLSSLTANISLYCLQYATAKVEHTNKRQE